MNKNCKQCHQEFWVTGKRKITAKFCSKDCKNKSMKGFIPWNKGIKYDQKMKERLNISGLNKGRTKEVNLKKKGKRYSPHTEFKKGHKVPLGKDHHCWKGGLEGFRKRIRKNVKYKEWRTAVFERDDFTCQKCGKRGTELNADHIVAFASLLRKHNVDSLQSALICSELWEIANGRTLCVICHRKTSTYGIRSVVASN